MSHSCHEYIIDSSITFAIKGRIEYLSPVAESMMKSSDPVPANEKSRSAFRPSSASVASMVVTYVFGGTDSDNHSL